MSGRPGLWLALLAAPLLAGCADPSFTTNEDAAFLRPMTEDPTEEKVDIRQMMPTHDIAQEWRMEFQSRDLRTGEAVNRTEETIVPLGMGTRQGRSAIGTATLNQRRVAYREEWFVNTAKGLRLLEAGGKEDRIILDPPLLVLPSPLIPERTYEWTGTIAFKGKAIPAWGLTRYRGTESIGGETAYCVETIVATRNSTGVGAIQLPMTRWFVPRKGMVRMWFQVGTTEYMRSLVEIRR